MYLVCDVLPQQRIRLRPKSRFQSLSVLHAHGLDILGQKSRLGGAAFSRCGRHCTGRADVKIDSNPLGVD